MTRRGKLLDSDEDNLWKAEKQVDAAMQHLRLALSILRKELSRLNKAGGRNDAD